MIIDILQNSWTIHEDIYTLIKHIFDINQLAFSMTMTGLITLASGLGHGTDPVARDRHVLPACLPACLPPSGFAEYYHIMGMKKRLGFI